jgi:hypothetical protein
MKKFLKDNMVTLLIVAFALVYVYFNGGRLGT